VDKGQAVQGGAAEDRLYGSAETRLAVFQGEVEDAAGAVYGQAAEGVTAGRHRAGLR